MRWRPPAENQWWSKGRTTRAVDSKNDTKPGKKREQRTADAPCFQRVVSLFSLCYLLLEKLSKSLIPLSDCPFVLNRLPVFLGKSPCFREKTDSQAMGLARSATNLPGEAPRLCRGGSKSLTFTAVVHR